MKNTKRIVQIVVGVIVVLVIIGLGSFLGARALAKEYIKKDLQTKAVSGVSDTAQDTRNDDRVLSADTENDTLAQNTENNAADQSTENNAAVQNTEKEDAASQDNTNSGKKGKSAQAGQTTDDQITLEEAKEIALADAGVSDSEVTYTKDKLDYDDGIAVYELEFYTASQKFEYDINTVSGEIVTKKAEIWNTSSKKGSNTSGSGSYIGVDKAKEIALTHAGFSESEVTFSKAKQDKDDGRMVYEVEFYKNKKEYEYKIDATSGTILEYEVD